MVARSWAAADQVVYSFITEGIRQAQQGNGVVSGGVPTQRAAGANLSIDTTAVTYRIGGTAYSAIAANTAVNAADATLPRMDLVYANAAGIQYLVGTAAAAPSATVLYPDPPDLPASSIPIALIEVAAGVTSILDARIIDCRSMLSGYGGLGSPTSSAVGDASADGTATTLSRSDHKHAREAFATPAIVLGTAAVAGVATTPIRSDATIVAFDATVPAAVGTAAAGSQAVAARRDHVHPTGAGTPSSQVLGDTAAIGTGPAAAMSDHKHALSNTLTAPTVNTSLTGTAVGSGANQVAAGNHTHAGGLSGGQSAHATITGDITTASTSLVDATGLTVTITTTGGDVLISFSGSAKNATTGANTFFTLLKDGVNVGGSQGLVFFSEPSGNYMIPVSFVWRDAAPTAASHTYKVQWYVGSSTGTLSGNPNATIVVQELPH